jgi:hypothetical protein
VPQRHRRPIPVEQHFERHVAGLGPAARARVVAAVGAGPHVERQADALRAVALEPFDRELGTPHRHAADHHATGAGGEQRGERRFVPHAAADLQAQALDRRDPADQVDVRRPAAARRVEIDQVQPARSAPRVRAGQLRGIGRVARRLGVVALAQPCHAAREHIDGGEDDHVSARKFRSTRAPTPADRSGWNWMPWKLRCETIAANGDPCSQPATASSPSGAA